MVNLETLSILILIGLYHFPFEWPFSFVFASRAGEGVRCTSYDLCRAVVRGWAVSHSEARDIRHSDIMCRYNLSSLLLLCSNDVETNPGPLTPLARGPNLEKAVTDLK